MELFLLCLLSALPLAWASFPLGYSPIGSFHILHRASPTSIDGNCGSNSDTNATCLMSSWGNCCSSKGFCGKTNTSYCSTDCQSSYGLCGNTAISANSSFNSSATGSPVPTATPTFLNTGAKAGIAVGSIVVAFAVLGLIVWYVIRGKRRNRGVEEMDADASSQSKTVMVQSALGTGLYEVDSTRDEAVEMPVTQRVSELAGNTEREDALVDEWVAAGYDGAVGAQSRI